MVLTVLVALATVGVEVASFVAILVAAGFAVGLALQGTLTNFAAGILLLVFRRFNVGDYVEIAGEKGFVRDLQLFFTKIDTRENRLVIVPNGDIFGSTITNIFAYDEVRVDCDVGTGSGRHRRDARDPSRGRADRRRSPHGKGRAGRTRQPRRLGDRVAGARVGDAGRLLSAEAGADPGGEVSPRRRRHRHSVPADGRSHGQARVAARFPRWRGRSGLGTWVVEPCIAAVYRGCVSRLSIAAVYRDRYLAPVRPWNAPSGRHFDRPETQHQDHPTSLLQTDDRLCRHAVQMRPGTGT